jgi:AraC family transcriptional regulator of adaptative response / DNA-3-methyladenine glycosylase II
MTQVAFAAGFGSVRRFNAAIRKIYHRTPTQIRSLAEKMIRQPENHYLFHLSFRPPYDWKSILDFLAVQAMPGVEVVRDGYYRRSISLQENRGYLEVSLDANRNALNVRVQFGDPRSLFFIIERVRAMFDLDADWATIARTLATDPTLAAQVNSCPGLRVPGCWNGFEFAARAILGQEMDSQTANALAGRMVTAFGEPFCPAGGLTHLFPTPEVLATADLGSIDLPQRQADAIRALSCLVRDAGIRFEKVADPDALLARLHEIPGIGRSALQWIAMRALREPDAVPSFDPDFARAVGVASGNEIEERSEAWRPWRAYAAMYLWRSDPGIGAREQASIHGD